MGREKAPTKRDQYWLDHEKKLAASGLTAKAYAAEQELSLHALYQARKRLRKLGLFESGSSKVAKNSDSSTGKSPVAFSRVEVQSPRATEAEFRLSLPGGAVLEWSGGEWPPAVVALVERLTSPR